MARDHARIKVKIWQNKDFRALPMAAQHTYLLVASHASLSYCGVMDYLPGRLAAMSKGTTAAKVEAAVKQLERGKFLVVDRDTAELAVRTYVRHDGVLDRRNMGKAMTRALVDVVSMEIRDAILCELARLLRDEPDLSGWDGIRELDATTFEEIELIASAMASPIPSRKASGE